MGERYDVALYASVLKRAHAGELSIEQADAIFHQNGMRGLNRSEVRSIQRSALQRNMAKNYRPRVPDTPRWAGPEEMPSVRRRGR
jgi:hypothetical protein